MSELATVFYKVIKHNSYCVICGSPDIQFHHVNPAQKLSEIYRVAKMGDMRATITELQKCIPLCQIHHTAVHKGQILGYLDGKFDNGGKSTAHNAAKFMPYLSVFARANRSVIFNFYSDYITREELPVIDILKEANLPVPKKIHLSGVLASYKPEGHVHNSTPDRVWPPLNTTRLRLANDISPNPAAVCMKRNPA